MWTELRTEKELAAFIRLVCGFHDSVLKDLSYVSGAYVDEKLNMYPVDDKACLRVLIQRQDETLPALELEFSGLQELTVPTTATAANKTAARKKVFFTIILILFVVFV